MAQPETTTCGWCEDPEQKVRLTRMDWPHEVTSESPYAPMCVRCRGEAVALLRSFPNPHCTLASFLTLAQRRAWLKACRA